MFSSSIRKEDPSGIRDDHFTTYVWSWHLVMYLQMMVAENRKSSIAARGSMHMRRRFPIVIPSWRDIKKICLDPETAQIVLM